MKKIHLIYAACLLVGMGACAASVQKQVKDNFDVWKEYNTGAVLFEDKAPSGVCGKRHTLPDKHKSSRSADPPSKKC